MRHTVLRLQRRAHLRTLLQLLLLPVQLLTLVTMRRQCLLQTTLLEREQRLVRPHLLYCTRWRLHTLLRWHLLTDTGWRRQCLTRRHLLTVRLWRRHTRPHLLKALR